MGALAQDTKRSEIKRKMDVAHLPETMEVHDRAQKKFIKLDAPLRWGIPLAAPGTESFPNFRHIQKWCTIEFIPI